MKYFAENAKATNKKHGFIMITILVILGLSYFLFDRIITSTTLFSTFHNNSEKECQLKQLIFLGISSTFSEMLLAEDQNIDSEEMIKVTVTEKDKNDASSEFKKPIDDRLKSFFYYTIPKLNVWKNLELKEETDGISAKIKTCLSCEEGKFFLPDLFNFEKNELNSAVKKVIKSFKFLNIKEEEGDLEKILLNFATKNEKKPFYDLSQLEFAQDFNFFYEPAKEKTSKEDSVTQVPEAFIADVFTLFYIGDNKTSSKINPFFLSNSLLKIMNMKTNSEGDKKDFSADLKKAIKEISYKTKKEEMVKIIQDIYKIKPSNNSLESSQKKDSLSESTTPEAQDSSNNFDIKTLSLFFTDKIEPEIFTLNCQAEYLGQIKKAVIIFRRQLISEKYKAVEKKSDEALENKKPEEKKDDKLFLRSFFLPDGFEIIRFYWL